MKRCHVESRRKGTSYTQYKEIRPNWTGHISHRNCLLKHVIEGKTEGSTKVTARQGRRRKQLLDDFKKRRVYWQLKEDALYVHNSLWKKLLNELGVILDCQCGQENKTNTTRSSWCPIQPQTVTALSNSGLYPCSNTACIPRRLSAQGQTDHTCTGTSHNLQSTAVLAASAALSSTIDTSSCNLSVTRRMM